MTKGAIFLSFYLYMCSTQLQTLPVYKRLYMHLLNIVSNLEERSIQLWTELLLNILLTESTRSEKTCSTLSMSNDQKHLRRRTHSAIKTSIAYRVSYIMPIIVSLYFPLPFPFCPPPQYCGGQFHSTPSPPFCLCLHLWLRHCSIPNI